MTAIVPPDLPKLIVNGTSTHKYVFTYKNHWDKELKRAVRSKGDSHCVGRYVPVEGQEGYGEIFFNDDFKAQYPELEYLRVFRRKGGKLEFKAIDDDLCNVVRSQEFLRLHAGASWALNQIVASSALARALKKTFPDHKTYLRLLSLAYYLVINRDASLCHYEEFAECTWLPYARPLTSGSISRLLRKIDNIRLPVFSNTSTTNIDESKVLRSASANSGHWIRLLFLRIPATSVRLITDTIRT